MSVLALLLLGVVFVGVAQAAHVQCGEVITSSVTLDSDVGPCPGNGLIVTKSGVTVDLNGFRVIGANGPDVTAGIFLQQVSGVTVKNGTVMNFDAGIVVFSGARNRLLGLTVQDNNGNSTDCGLGDGIVTFGSNKNIIQGNTVVRNGPLSGIAIVDRSSGNMISENTVTDNVSYSPACGPVQNIGIRLEGPGTTFNRVNYNTVNRNALFGIHVHSAGCFPNDQDCLAMPPPPNSDNLIANNLVAQNGAEAGNGGGIVLGLGFEGTGPYNNTVRKNKVLQNVDDGIRVGRGSLRNTLERNQGSENARFDGADFNFEPPCDQNLWSYNRFVTVNQPCVAANGGTGTVPEDPDPTAAGNTALVARGPVQLAS